MQLSKETYNKLINNSIDVKQSKYHNKKVYYDGHWFDSQKEKSWYIKFKLMEQSGVILDLKLQVKYELIKTFKLEESNAELRKIKWEYDRICTRYGGNNCE